tara:strand:- start:88 stop:522 length:435 start_codon:yes stop_codon:yes gene_type:complete
MASTISTNGRKKLKTLQDEFNDKFSQLKIEFSLKPTIDKKGEQILQSKSDLLDNNKTLSEVRTKTGSGKISINGRKKVENLEKEFQAIFGLYVQVSRWTLINKKVHKISGPENWIQTYTTDDWNLTKQNKFSLEQTSNPPKKDW